jgi:hypothetical protein
MTLPALANPAPPLANVINKTGVRGLPERGPGRQPRVFSRLPEEKPGQEQFSGGAVAARSTIEN